MFPNVESHSRGAAAIMVEFGYTSERKIHAVTLNNPEEKYTCLYPHIESDKHNNIHVRFQIMCTFLSGII